MGPACQKNDRATDNDLHIQATKDVPDGFVKQYLSDTKGALMFFVSKLGMATRSAKSNIVLPS